MAFAIDVARLETPYDFTICIASSRHRGPQIQSAPIKTYRHHIDLFVCPPSGFLSQSHNTVNDKPTRPPTSALTVKKTKTHNRCPSFHLIIHYLPKNITDLTRLRVCVCVNILCIN